MAPRKLKQVAQLKPEMKKKKNLKARVEIKRLKSKMEKIREDEECIKDEQRKISSTSVEIERQCDQLKAETETIMKQTARTLIKVALMFKILKAPESGDCSEAATLTRCLRELVAMERANASSGEHP